VALPVSWSYKEVGLRNALGAAGECSSRSAGTVPGAAAIAANAALAVAVATAADAPGDRFPEAREAARAAELAVLVGLVREIFGNPFRPTRGRREWLTDTAVSLARRAYEAPDFAILPFLADPLQDAGCEDAQILDHCRRGAGHVRGCWAVELVPGKE
jgi:hypothetical protein